MNVKDGLARAGPVVNDRTKAGSIQAAVPRQIGRNGLQMAQHGFVFSYGIRQFGQVLSRNYQNVRGGLGVDILEGENGGIVIDDLCGDFPPDDAAKEAMFCVIRHGSNFTPYQFSV